MEEAREGEFLYGVRGAAGKKAEPNAAACTASQQQFGGEEIQYKLVETVTCCTTERMTSFTKGFMRLSPK